MLQVLFLLLQDYLYYCLWQFKYSTPISISKVLPIYYLNQNALDPSRKPVLPVRRGKENKQKSWKTLLTTDENQDIYSCDRLFTKPTLVYSQVNLLRQLATFQMELLYADFIFDWKKEDDEQLPISNLIFDKIKSERRTLSYFLSVFLASCQNCSYII